MREMGSLKVLNVEVKVTHRVLSEFAADSHIASQAALSSAKSVKKDPVVFSHARKRAATGLRASAGVTHRLTTSTT